MLGKSLARRRILQGSPSGGDITGPTNCLTIPLIKSRACPRCAASFAVIGRATLRIHQAESEPPSMSGEVLWVRTCSPTMPRHTGQLPIREMESRRKQIPPLLEDDCRRGSPRQRNALFGGRGNGNPPHSQAVGLNKTRTLTLVAGVL